MWLLGDAAFCVMLVLGLVGFAIQQLQMHASGALLAPLALLGVAVLALSPVPVRRAWHAVANAFPQEPTLIALPFVLDGDTIDDLATGIRYRLANIDAPETGDLAKCATERHAGEDAKLAATACVHAAKVVAVRKTWRTDRFGRRVAFVLIDGRDLGERLMASGLAAPWRGRRVQWCGVNGAFAQHAAKSGGSFACKFCTRSRR